MEITVVNSDNPRGGQKGRGKMNIAIPISLENNPSLTGYFPLEKINGIYDLCRQLVSTNMLDVLQKQRDSLMKTNTRIYDLRSILSIISAFLLPILADFAKKNIILLLESEDIANQGISILNSLLNKII